MSCLTDRSRTIPSFGVAGPFFFSSRRRHTRYIGDWSSDVCSSDLVPTWFTDQIVEAAWGRERGQQVHLNRLVFDENWTSDHGDGLYRHELEHTLQAIRSRSEEHTSELQSPMYLVCRLLLEKKKKKK